MAPVLLWVGLGNMGRGMCKNIVHKGAHQSPLLLYNRSKQRAVDLSAALPKSSSEVIEKLDDGVSKADIIFTCLANDAVVKTVFESMLEKDVNGKLFIECSTIHPDTTVALSKAAVAKGAEFASVPIFGPPAAAEAGQLVAVLAGPKSSVDKARPWFKGVTARDEIDLSGRAVSAASALKVLGNTFVLNMIEQLAEAHVVAEKSGLGTQAIHEFIGKVMPGPAFAYSTRMLSGDYHKREGPLFGVDLARKDAGHARDIATSVGVTLHNLEVADRHLAAVQAHAGSSGDIAGIYGAMRQEAGLEFEIDS